ncbi:MAG: substrate-binding domain-containing protein, partial [Clostridiales bacterium]|nr:substrate-binding domain-containing protein [Clostridiales bacterium]
MKKIFTLIMSLLLVFALFGCAKENGGGGTEPTEDDTVFVGFSTVTLNIPYYAEMAEVFESECDAKGWKHTTLVNNMNVEQQINDCLDLLQQDVDVLVIASWWGDSIHEVLEAAAAKGVPVFFLNTGGLTDADEFASHVIADDVAVGEYAGVYTAKYFLAQGVDDIKMVTTTSDSGVGRNRADGFYAGLEKGGLKYTLLNEYMVDSKETAMQAIEDALTANDHIDLIYGIGTNNNMGELDALTAAQRDDAIIIGWDCAEEDKAAIDAGGPFKATLVVSATYEMQTTVKNIETVLGGGTVDKIVNYYPVLYTFEGEKGYDDVYGN